MGLDFSHCDASWSYSGFNNFRRRLAKEIGVDIDEMEGFNGDRPWSEVDDDIVHLLDHSDCDGDLSPNQCVIVAIRLEELVKSWPDDINVRTRLSYYRTQAQLLAEGMRRAAAAAEPLEFR